jgi:predicted secreted protein
MIVGLFSLVLVASDPASAPVTAAQTPPPAAAAKPAKEKKICKTDDADSGSHMVRRVCLTRQEWEQRGQGMMNSGRSGFSGTAENH